MEHWGHYRDLVIVLTRKEMKVRYKRSILGYFWSIANPLALATVLFVAFQLIAKFDIDNYPLFLICGLFPWQWLNNSLSFAPSVLIGNAQIIKKTSFPKTALLLAHVLHDTIHFLLSIPIVVVFLLIFGKLPSWNWMYGVPLLLLIQLLLCYSGTLLIASVNLFFRDIERLIVTFMVLAFYCTPVIYSQDMAPAGYRALIYANPFAPIIISWRSLLLDGSFEPIPVLLSALYAIVGLSIAYPVYRKLEWRFAEVL